MATATLPLVWRGRSGRDYVPADGTRVRHGGMATVRKVTGRGGAVGTSTPPDGIPLALKMWHEGDDASLDQLQAEARTMIELSRHEGDLPCPRLFDVVGQPLVTGLVMEWCPLDLERWWREKLKEPDAFGRLMATMGDVCRRLADYHDFFGKKKGLVPAHGDLKPSNVLLAANGRWLISDFGTARVRPPEEAGWSTSRIVAGTENFLAPEVLFHGRRAWPAAIDTWSMAATLVALLRLQRLILDNGQVPRNGTHSPRFRMQRIMQVLEVYDRDPMRFRDRDLDANAFPDPLRLPEEDRRAVRDCLRGVFGTDDPNREDKLGEELLAILDHAMSIDPKHRYTDARALGAAFEGLTRTYIGLLGSTSVSVEGLEEDLGSLARERDDAHERVRELEEQVGALHDRLRARESGRSSSSTTSGDPDVQSEATTQGIRIVHAEVPQNLSVRLPRSWGFVMTLIFMLSVSNLILVLGVLAFLVATWMKVLPPPP